MAVNKSSEHLENVFQQVPDESERSILTYNIRRQSVSNFFIVMDRTVIHDDNALFPWKWI